MYDDLKKELKSRSFEASVLSDMIGRGINKSQILLAIGTAISRRESDIEFLTELKTKLEKD